MLDALTTLIFNGDYTTWFNTIGIEEDHWFINLILTVFGH